MAKTSFFWRNQPAIACIAILTCTLQQESTAVEHLFVVTNRADANTIAVYEREDGKLFSSRGEFPTGGRGTGDLEIPALEKDPNHPLANGDDPLISAYGIVADATGNRILTVNAGDGTISLLKRDGPSLTLTGIAKGTDRFPVSVAINGSVVVAASVGGSNNEGSIGAYRVADDGSLSLVEGSRRDLSARPSTIAISEDGRFTVVNELVTGKIHVFAIDDGQLSAKPISTIDSPRGEDRFQAVPVGFNLLPGRSGEHALLMSEARFLTPDFKLREGNGEVPLTPDFSWQTGSLSSYRIDASGMIKLVSGDVLTGESVEGGEIANCWTEVSADGRILWAANALSSSISTFAVAPDATVKLRNATAWKSQSELMFFSDLELSPDGKSLYQLVGNLGQILVFDIAEGGDLELRQVLDGIPLLGTYGLLALN